MHYPPHSASDIPRQAILPLKLDVGEIFQYLFNSFSEKDETGIIARINTDSMPIRMNLEKTEPHEKYNNFFIKKIEFHKAKSKNFFSEETPTKANIYKILSISLNQTDETSIASENLHITTHEMYADRDDIIAYGRKEQSLDLPAEKQVKTRVTKKREDKLEKIIAIFTNLLAQESIKSKSSKFVKGDDTVNVQAISRAIIELAQDKDIPESLSSDSSLATDINKILTMYQSLRKL